MGLGPKDQTACYTVYNYYLVEARSPSAHEVRSEEATARRRQRRKDPERMKLTRDASMSLHSLLVTTVTYPEE